ncbi:MAG: hypothetical protein IJM37_03565 [Lachnospiraceae bacterium]|nr:hypothetical protein [Lachnospiraceae bacterium]
MELLLATLIEYLIKFIILVAIVALAVFCGIKVRKIVDKKNAEKAALEEKAAKKAEE